MIRFSDIPGEDKDKKSLRPPKEAKEKEGTPGSIGFPSVSNEKGLFAPDKSSLKEQEKPSHDIEFSSIEKKGIKPEFSLEDVGNLYDRAVVLAEKIFNSDLDLTAPQLKEVHQLVEDLVDCVQNASQKLLGIIFKSLPEKVNFVSLNLVNVCILSLEMGVGLGYSRSHLLNLGVPAFLHDIGMKGYLDLISQSRQLTPEEREQVQQHPLVSSQTLRNIEGSLKSSILGNIEQEHERIDGSGYPRGLKSEEISEAAQIIGLMDVYEALTHERPHRKKLTSLDAVKIALKDKSLFSPKLMKVFLERIGFYPRGSFVRLNTKEVAEVARGNSEIPLCPIVRVVYDSEGEKTEKGREIDLSKGTKIYITGSL